MAGNRCLRTLTSGKLLNFQCRQTTSSTSISEVLWNFMALSMRFHFDKVPRSMKAVIYLFPVRMYPDKNPGGKCGLHVSYNSGEH
eukprot:6308755-Amphidinium_carterae.1